jgi:CBS domain-containing protein
MNVKEAMTTNLITFKEDTSLGEVVRTFHDKGISGAPVIDDDDKLIGIVTESDLIKLATRSAELEKESEDLDKGFNPQRTSGLGRTSQILLAPFLGFKLQRENAKIDRIIQESELLRLRRVRDIMTRQVITIATNEPLAKAVAMMNKFKINRIPVLDVNRNLVGMITRDDIIKSLAKEYRKA